MSRTRMYPALAVAFFLGACSSAPPQLNEAVERARGEVRAAAADPDVVRHARTELDLAQDAFAEAERSWRRGSDQDVVSHWASVAQQRAATAREAARARRTEELAREAERRRSPIAVAEAAPEERAGAADPAASPHEPLDRLMARDITVPFGDELFVADGVELDQRAAPTIERVVALLRQDPSRTVRIEAHSGDLGSPGRNLEVSGRRGDAIRSALVARGIDARRISVQALGDSFPVASNETALGRARNRRVDIVIVTPR